MVAAYIWVFYYFFVGPTGFRWRALYGDAKYPDGYEKWISKETFEEVCVVEDDSPLLATVFNMKSPDYKKRFEAEYRQLKIRYESLKRMCEKWDAGELDFTPTCPRATYDKQMAAMVDYLSVLEVRAYDEGIDLWG